MSNNMKKISKAAIAVSAAATMTLGGTAVASANPLGSLGSSASDLAVPKGEETRLGNVGGPVWNVDVFKTLHGSSEVKPGGTIKTRIEIKGVKGEFYPCKPDIFAATYEPVV